MADNIIRLVWDKDSDDVERHPEGRPGKIIDLRRRFPIQHLTAEFLEELVVYRRNPLGDPERYGLFEVNVHCSDGKNSIEELYFPSRYKIPELTLGVIYQFAVFYGCHPEIDEDVLYLCHNTPIARLP